MIEETSGKLGVFFWPCVTKRRFPLYPAMKKNQKKEGGGGKNFCNFVAEYTKRIVVLTFMRYKTRYKKIILSRIDYE